MSDTDLINEIIYKLKVNNTGHFDRGNLLDSLDKLDFYILRKTDDSDEVEQLSKEIKALKDGIEDIIEGLEDLI